MREVAFAQQMTEGEKGGLSPSLAKALDSPLVRGGRRYIYVGFYFEIT